MSIFYDITGAPLAVGDICTYAGINKKYRGRCVVVRAISAHSRGHLLGDKCIRVDDEVNAPDDSDNWSWSAWLVPTDLAKVNAPNASGETRAAPATEGTVARD